jgi:uncharacterized SAM-binding protein YcdF (DUF218 family)
MKDVIIVLGGGIRENGELVPTAQERVEKAVELYKKNVARKILMSGRYGISIKYIPIKTEAKAMKEHAMSLGVPEEDILTEETSRDTLGNAYFTKTKFLEPRGWKNIMVITTNFHLERAKAFFTKILGEGYDIDFEATEVILPEEKDKKVVERGEKIFAFWMNKLGDGDEEHIKKLIFEEHPAYSENPKYSVEEMDKMIDETEV